MIPESPLVVVTRQVVRPLKLPDRDATRTERKIKSPAPATTQELARCMPAE